MPGNTTDNPEDFARDPNEGEAEQETTAEEMQQEIEQTQVEETTEELKNYLDDGKQLN
jgi:hypothetical protein